MGMQTPIVLLIYNRAELTAHVFAAIRKARPTQLFVVADGPHAQKPGDEARVAAARAAVTAVDWPCTVVHDFAEHNLGLRTRVASGLSAVFARVERAIVLEDDCVPEPSFFRFCEELLERYADDERVMTISGNNFQRGRRRGDASYYFSRYNHCWGWATWQRAWRHYDDTMQQWPAVREGGWLTDLLGDRRVVRFWHRQFQAVYKSRVSSWALRWMLNCWLQSGLSVLPAVNLVSNIGFGKLASNTGAATSPFAALPTAPMAFPLRHPPFVVRDVRADAFTQRTLFDPPLATRLRWRIIGR